MQMLVDADACPVVIREILYRAAQKRQLKTHLICQSVISGAGFATDQPVPGGSGARYGGPRTCRRVEAGDLVVTADIPLASEVLEKGALVMTPRGERYTENNIKQRLQMRDFMETMRASGQHTGGPPPLNQTDRKAFADQLDRLLSRALKSG